MACRSVSLSEDEDCRWEHPNVAAPPLEEPQLRCLRDSPQQGRSASSSISGSSKQWRLRREATPAIAEVDENRNQDNAPPRQRRNYGLGELHVAWSKPPVVPTGRGHKNQMDRPAASSSSAVAAPGKRSHGNMRGAAVAAPQWRRLVKHEPSSVCLQTALDDQGPDTSLRSFNPQTDQKNTINLTVAQFVVFQSVDPDEFRALLWNNTAALLVVLYGPHSDPALIADVINSVVLACGSWRCKTLGVYGKVLYRPCRISSVHLQDCVTMTDDACLLQTMRVVLEGNSFNPSTAVAAGVMFPAFACEKSWLPYSPALLQKIKTTLHKRQVRILFGVFTSCTEQVSDIGRSCGAIGGRPFCQMFLYNRSVKHCCSILAERFSIDTYNGGNYVTHPAYIIVLGPCSKQTHAPVADAPVLPPWLDEVEHWSNLVHNLSRIPSWDADADPCEEAERLRSGGNQLLDLGNVKQKPTYMGKWVANVHQVMLYFGTSRSGKVSRKNHQHKQKLDHQATAEWSWYQKAQWWNHASYERATPGQWYNNPQ